MTLSQYSYSGLFYKVHIANIDSGHTENLTGKKIANKTNLLITLPLVAVFVYLFEILIFVRPPNLADPHCSFEKHNSLMYYSLMITTEIRKGYLKYHIPIIGSPLNGIFDSDNFSIKVQTVRK